MADHSPLSAPERIERALDRIEHAVAQRAQASTALDRRHAQLRQRVTDALAAIDAVIAAGEDS